MTSTIQTHGVLVQCPMCSRLNLGSAAYRVKSGRVGWEIAAGQKCLHCDARLDAGVVAETRYAGAQMDLRPGGDGTLGSFGAGAR